MHMSNHTDVRNLQCDKCEKIVVGYKAQFKKHAHKKVQEFKYNFDLWKMSLYNAGFKVKRAIG